MESRNDKIYKNGHEKKEDNLDLMIEKTIETISNFIDNHKSVAIWLLIAIAIVLIMILIKKNFLRCIQKCKKQNNKKIEKPVKEQNQVGVIQIENTHNNVYELTTPE